MRACAEENTISGQIKKYEVRLTEEFYTQRAPQLAPRLLGMLLCRQTSDGIRKYRITETEAYFGTEDTACHAHKGKTNRTKILWKKGGLAYIYLCYGIHEMLNVVSGPEGFPEAVLVRGIEGADGPGKLTKKLDISRKLNWENLTDSIELWIEDDGYKPEYTALPRVGINYADEHDRNICWRFVLTNI